MRERITPAITWRFALGVVALLFGTACGSTSGCNGCTPQTIPGGFPANQRIDNAMQVRLAQGGINYLENNLESLVTALVPGGLSFSFSGGTAKVDIVSVDIAPTPKSSMKLTLQGKATATMKNYKITSLPLVGDVKCDISYKSSSPLRITGSVDLTVQASNGNKLGIAMNGVSLSNFQVSDVKLSGAWYCSVGDVVKKIPGISNLIENEIDKQMKKALADAMGGMLKGLPMGQEGRVDVGSLLSAYSPNTSGTLDYFVWAGGYAQAENAGMSVGAMAGFRTPKHNPCVPDCTKPGAKCKMPLRSAIPWSTTLKGNKQPDGKDFHVGIGVHKQALDNAAYAFYASGALCLDVGTAAVSQLNSATFAVLLNSINNLTGGVNAPVMLAIRPRNPPTMELGKGTFTKDASGNITITDPLLRLKAKDFAIDLYVLSFERMVRVFTILTDLDVPMLLDVKAGNKLQPILGDLKSAFKNIRLQNHELITENPQVVTALLPTLISLASGQLAGSLPTFDLPAMSGVKLVLNSGSITGIDKVGSGYNLLGIFAKLAPAATTNPMPLPQTETEAEVALWEVPPTEVFRGGPAQETWVGPTLVLRLGARLAPEQAGGVVEYSYRVDGGFWRPWTDATQLTVQDPLFWVQGKHTVEVRSRLRGEPDSEDTTPVAIPLVVDTLAPQVRLIEDARGVTVQAEDLVSGREELEVAWSIDGQPFGPYGRQLSIQVPEGTRVAVKVRDANGNEAKVSSAGRSSTYLEDEFGPATGGCAVAGDPTGAPAALLLLALLALARRRRN